MIKKSLESTRLVQKRVIINHQVYGTHSYDSDGEAMLHSEPVSSITTAGLKIIECFFHSDFAAVLCGVGVRNIITLALTEITAGETICKASNG